MENDKDNKAAEAASMAAPQAHSAHPLIIDENLPPQQRLELALQECGRVRGTLASQERVIESQCAEITGLAAKFQKKQKLAFKLMLLLAAVSLLAVVTVLLFDAVKSREIILLQRQYEESLRQDRASSDAKFAEQLKDIQKAKQDMAQQVSQAKQARDAEAAESIDKQRKEMNAKLAEETEKARQAVKEQVVTLEQALKNARDESERNRAKATDMEEINRKLAAEKAALQARADEMSRSIAAYDQLKKENHEMEAELATLRRRAPAPEMGKE